jgi:hypothetical protein
MNFVDKMRVQFSFIMIKMNSCRSVSRLKSRKQEKKRRGQKKLIEEATTTKKRTSDGPVNPEFMK